MNAARRYGIIYYTRSGHQNNKTMFYHVKELQSNARVSKPDPVFAILLLEQFGDANGELAAALRYFGQALGSKKAISRQI